MPTEFGVEDTEVDNQILNFKKRHKQTEISMEILKKIYEEYALYPQ